VPGVFTESISLRRIDDGAINAPSLIMVIIVVVMVVHYGGHIINRQAGPRWWSCESSDFWMHF